SFKKLKAVEVSGFDSTQETPTNDPKEMSEEDVQNMLKIVPVSKFKVEALHVKKYQNLRRKPVSIAQARKNMIIYLKNMDGYKMEHFRRMTYDKMAKRLQDEEVKQAAAREKKYQNLRRKPVSIAQARKNMIIYLKNMDGYKMEHFRRMTYDKDGGGSVLISVDLGIGWEE
nr:hypothetical protein [Tanacetum cinerariifolium]